MDLVARVEVLAKGAPGVHSDIRYEGFTTSAQRVQYVERGGGFSLGVCRPVCFVVVYWREVFCCVAAPSVSVSTSAS